MIKWRARLKERSTYVGMAVLLGLTGVMVPVETLELLGAGLLGIVGVIETMRAE